MLLDSATHNALAEAKTEAPIAPLNSTPMPQPAFELDPDSTHYVFIKLAETERVIKQASLELPALRQKLDTCMNTSKMKDEIKKKAYMRDVAGEMQNLYTRLINAIQSTQLLFYEMELPQMAEMASKLVSALRAFKLMTPDYTKLVSALHTFLSKFPIEQDGTGHGKKANDGDQFYVVQ